MSSPPSPPAASDRFNQALRLHQSGSLDEAEQGYRSVLEELPQHADALHLLGVVLQQRGRLDEATGLIRQSIAIDGARANPHSNLAIALNQLGRNDEALAALDNALRIKPAYPEALANRGNVLRELGRLDEALESYERALALRPAEVGIQLNRGELLHALGRPEDALAASERVLESHPALPRALVLRGNALRSLHRHALALACYERALQSDPGHFAALVGSGNALQSLHRHMEALEAYKRALAVQPGALEVLNNRGAVLRDLKRYADAAESFRLLEAARPDWDYVESNRLHSQLYCCDWTGYRESVDRIEARVMAGEPADVPFSFLAISNSRQAQLRCARRYVSDRFPARPALATQRSRTDDRIHIAYLSSDFHAHATSYLMAGLFERHDREAFRVTAISFGPDARDAMRDRILPAFDDFVEVRRTSDLEAARLVNSMGVDIAIDLKGFTVGNRAGILAHRPAPLQVNYLGYPGTMGASYIDYLIADERVIRPGEHADYSEKIVSLPDSYQVNDAARSISPREFSRADAGLPEKGFVFCCFNNNYKISPDVFQAWMRLLKGTPGSVLWLLEDNSDASRNLRSEANRSGVAPERLVFARRLPVDEHLARQRLADLFLDTLPCNAHTTASDALWAGLPVLTCTGSTFAGRVASSLLHALEMPELVMPDARQWEEMAGLLATNPKRLLAIRGKLAGKRLTAPLFDTDRTRLHLESAYRTMWQCHLRGEPPGAFSVARAP